MKGILIDVKNRVVREVEINKDDILKSLYELIGCDLVDRVGLTDTDDIWVDDEGLLTANDDTNFFSLVGHPSPFAGNGLVLGYNKMGDSVEPKITVESVRMKVKFYTMKEIQRMGHWE